MNPFPGYSHIGPGNIIKSKGDNPLDEIARRHDIDYGSALNEEDIKLADKKFLKELNNYSTDSIYEYIVLNISHLGILTKSYIESKIGVLYPRFNNNQKKEIINILNNKNKELNYNNKRKWRIVQFYIDTYLE